MTTPGIERKVRQLDHDVQAIYEMLAGITATQQRQGNRLEEIASTQAEHTLVLAEHGAKLDEHGTKLDSHGAKLDGQSTKLDEQSTKLDEILRLLRANG